MLPELLFFKYIPMCSWICLISLPFGQVLDEADRLLNEDFEESLNEILGMIPRERRTFLFSATMTKKVKM
jgi:hypothetical protein